MCQNISKCLKLNRLRLRPLSIVLEHDSLQHGLSSFRRRQLGHRSDYQISRGGRSIQARQLVFQSYYRLLAYQFSNGNSLRLFETVLVEGRVMPHPLVHLCEIHSSFPKYYTTLSLSVFMIGSLTSPVTLQCRVRMKLEI